MMTWTMAVDGDDDDPSGGYSEWYVAMTVSMGVLVVMAEESGNDGSGNKADGLQVGQPGDDIVHVVVVATQLVSPCEGTVLGWHADRCSFTH